MKKFSKNKKYFLQWDIRRPIRILNSPHKSRKEGKWMRATTERRQAIIHNALYQPKNKKYKAGKNVTFAPEGYITEEEAIQKVSPNLPKKTKDKKNKEEELVQLLGDLKETDPKLFKRLKEIVSE